MMGHYFEFELWTQGASGLPADIDTSRCAIGFVGTSAQIVEQMRPFIEPGVDYFMFDCVGFL